MSEQSPFHNQDPAQNAFSPEEFHDAEQTLAGMQSFFANRMPNPGAAPEQQAIMTDNELVPMVTTYLSNGEMYGTKPEGRDVVAAMMAGAVQHPANIEGLVSTLARGGRLQRETVDMITANAQDRARMRIEYADPGASAREVQVAYGIVDGVDKRIENGLMTADSSDARVLRSYASGILAQFPPYMSAARDTLAAIAPSADLPPVPDRPSARMQDRLG